MRPRAIFYLLIAAALLNPAALAAELWKCQDGTFTNIKPAAGKKCEMLKGASVCGAGKNRFINKGSSENSDSDCSGESDSSPFVNMKLVEAWKREKAAKGSAPKKATPGPQPKVNKESASPIAAQQIPSGAFNSLLELLN